MRLAALFIKWAVVIEFIMFMAKGLIVGALYFLCIFKYKCKFFYSMFVFWRKLIYNCNNGDVNY